MITRVRITCGNRVISVIMVRALVIIWVEAEAIFVDEMIMEADEAVAIKVEEVAVITGMETAAVIEVASMGTSTIETTDNGVMEEVMIDHSEIEADLQLVTMAEEAEDEGGSSREIKIGMDLSSTDEVEEDNKTISVAVTLIEGDAIIATIEVLAVVLVEMAPTRIETSVITTSEVAAVDEDEVAVVPETYSEEAQKMTMMISKIPLHITKEKMTKMTESLIIKEETKSGTWSALEVAETFANQAALERKGTTRRRSLKTRDQKR